MQCGIPAPLFDRIRDLVLVAKCGFLRAVLGANRAPQWRATLLQLITLRSAGQHWRCCLRPHLGRARKQHGPSTHPGVQLDWWICLLATPHPATLLALGELVQRMSFTGCACSIGSCSAGLLCYVRPVPAALAEDVAL